MKKKREKQTRSQREYDNSDFTSLDSALGAFGIDPPKRYKREDKTEVYEDERSSRRDRERKQKRKPANPKTRQQRVKEQNEKRKKSKVKRNILTGILIAVGIIAVVVVLSLTVWFKINLIEIKGNQLYTVDEIEAVLPIEEEDNLFLTDTGSAARKLEEKLPYIYQAEIKRKLPSTIEVNITETPTVFAILNEDETYTLVDDNFKVLYTSAETSPQDAVIITNAAITAAVVGTRMELGDEKVMENLLTLADAINRLELDKITSISSIDINNNYMIYENRITYKLGTLDNLDNKIYSALAATEELNESNPQVEGVMTLTNDKQVYFTEE